MPNLIFPQNNADSNRLSKLVAKGQLKRIRQGIYADADWNEIPRLLENNWHQIVTYLYPSAIASHATAILLKPQNRVVHITADVKIRKKVAISDALIIEVHPGDTQQLTQPFTPTLCKSAPARYLLENLQTAHKDVAAPKALGRKRVEQELCNILARYGEDELNQIRDDAKDYSHAVGLSKEFEKLDSLIGALQSTHSMSELTTPRALAISKKEPFDEHRISLFETFFQYLNQCHLPNTSYTYNKADWRNLAFYESYFSNYIEGTEFEIDEAEEIVFARKEVKNRHQDSHDVLSIFDLVQDYTEMATVPNSAAELLQLLQQRHGLIMHARPDKRPGEFKIKANKAGDTLFVLPENIEGTLTQAFPLYQTLSAGIARALFMQFLIAETHPFDDGNGRLARIMMNAELVAAEQHKIIVPTVHRDSYVNGLRQATRSGRFRTITKVFTDLQAYTSSIPWQDYGEAKATLESQYANRLPDEGVAVFNRHIAKYNIPLPPG